MNISDIMTVDPITVQPETTLGDAGRIMLDQRLSALPVIDRDGILLGILTDGDLLRRPELDTAPAIGWWRGFLEPETSADQFVKTRGRRVSEVMTEKLLSVTADTPLIDAVDLMQSHRIKQVPVMHGTRLIGLLTRRNVLAALISRLPVADDLIVSDDTIATTIEAAITQSHWAPKNMVRITVRAGVVTIAGPVFSDSERRAIIVIAENTSGVKSVDDQMVFVDSTSGVAFGSF
ncbi:MAG: CBS domain-containing protein [Acidiphilium sp.]|nr:CBS domain-containing protein [Acidiphilium sp.]MDD4934498.1 CBS domain-containing protein [Acidiphilium sp.]